MAVRTSALTTPTQSTTGTLKRTVSDTIRHLFPGAPIMGLVSSGMATMKEAKREKGLIGKLRVETPKFENFTYIPQAIEFTVSARTSDTDFSVSSADGLRPKMTLVNTKNMSVCRLSTVNTSTGALTCVETGGTSWSVAVNDKLLAMGPAYGENSNSPYILMKDPDNNYNFTQIFRFAVAISRTAKGNPHYGGMRWRHVKEENVVEGLRKVENSMLFSDRASGSNETTSDGTLGDSYRTMRGLWKWAQKEFPVGGALTHDEYVQELPNIMHESVGPGMRLVQFNGYKVLGRMQAWANDKNQVMQPDKALKVFGVEAFNFYTAKGTIKVILHDAFDRGEMANCALVFAPELVDYVHLRDDDFKAKPSIQNNDVDGQEDEILGEVSIMPRDAGYSMTKITGWNS